MAMGVNTNKTSTTEPPGPPASMGMMAHGHVEDEDPTLLQHSSIPTQVCTHEADESGKPA
jgi:hypothetical protein